MSDTQHDLMLKAFGMLFRKQMQPKAMREQPQAQKLGTIRHLKRCESSLPPEAREAFKDCDFTSSEDLQILQPYLKPVSVFYRPPVVTGKAWSKEPSKKELARAAKRLAKPA